MPFDRFRRDGLQTIAALSPEEALIEMKRRVLMRPAGTMMKDPRLLLVITNLGLGGAQRAFRDHSVALAKHFSVQEAVFNLEGGNLFPSGNPLTSLEVAGGGGPLSKLVIFALVSAGQPAPSGRPIVATATMRWRA